MASKFRNPPAFTATGKGLANALPAFQATPQNANGIFTNLGKQPGDQHRELLTWVTSVQTNWQIAGGYGQSVGARTWYPRNLSQSELTINGQMGNQFQYDQLVEFIEAHHNIAVDLNTVDNFVGTKAIDFKLLPYRIITGIQQGVPQYRYIHRGMHLQGYIQGIQAGHQRFVNAPTWTLNFRISNDFLQEPVNLQGELNRILYTNYLGLFGTFYKGPKITGATPVAPTNTDGFGNMHQHRDTGPTP